MTTKKEKKLKQEIKSRQETTNKILEVMNKEEQFTVAEILDNVEPYRYYEKTDKKFTDAQEDFNQNKKILEDVQSHLVTLKTEEAQLVEQIKFGNASEEILNKFYEVKRDQHSFFGKEIALINRLTSSAVVFWAIICESIPSETNKLNVLEGNN